MSYASDVDNYLKSQLVCDGMVHESPSNRGEYVVRGQIKGGAPDALVVYWAANPPTFSQSYYGSAHPYPNPSVAYENTPNKGSVRCKDGYFEFRVYYPNAYYVGLGTVYVEPHVNIKVSTGSENDEVHRITLGNGVPFRTLTYAPPTNNYPRYNPLFYQGLGQLPVRTQESILRSSAFPDKNEYPTNFWGMKPPV
jgi:hypothetical protein